MTIAASVRPWRRGDRDFRLWHETDHPGRSGEVRCWGKTGSQPPTSKPTRMTHLRTSARPQALTEPLLPFGGAEGRRPPAKAAFNPARRLSEQLLRYPLNGVAAELRHAVAERQEVFEGR
jgi:hypothetical protein